MAESSPSSSVPAPSSEEDVQPVAPDLGVENPPTTLGGILRRVGPGLILAGSIVGSGELIMTTRTGAEAGFWLLWLIVIGCVIKVFVQVELGRFTISTGKTTLDALNEVPGPRISIPLGNSGKRRFAGNWITLFWLLMFLATIGQLGGIVGGVGQAMAISWPLTEQGREWNEALDARTKLRTAEAELTSLEAFTPAKEDAIEHFEAIDAVRAERDRLNVLVAQLGEPPQSNDDKYWAAIIGGVTVIMLVVGRYGFIEMFSMILVGLFTLITIGNLFALQSYDAWAVTSQNIADGFSFKLPPADASPASADGKQLDPLTTALATFGIIGVGASELMAYPYWCIEKGYARWTGTRDGSTAWIQRAKGWLRVMKVDAWGSMVLYTFATVAFYLLGAAVLHRSGLLPEGGEMIRTLAVMYEPAFGHTAQLLFLFGAFAVLYSTFFVANAANTRLAADIIPSFGLSPLTDRGRLLWIRIFGALFPVACVVIYAFVPQPVLLVTISGIMQALLLPMLAFAALFFRYKRCDDRLKPSLIWDAMLFLSFIGFVVVGVYLTITKAPALWNVITGGA